VKIGKGCGYIGMHHALWPCGDLLRRVHIDLHLTLELDDNTNDRAYVIWNTNML